MTNMHEPQSSPKRASLNGLTQNVSMLHERTVQQESNQFQLMQRMSDIQSNITNHLHKNELHLQRDGMTAKIMEQHTHVNVAAIRMSPLRVALLASGFFE